MTEERSALSSPTSRTRSRLLGIFLVLAGTSASRHALPTERSESLPTPRYLQFGLAFQVELATRGTFCSDPDLDCILGSGAGVTGRVGYRFHPSWYVGGAYALTKQDPGSLYRIAILQQLRAELRYYVLPRQELSPTLMASVGAVAYGNEWALDSGGPTLQLGGGFEWQPSKGPALGLLVVYRPMFLGAWSLGSSKQYGPGLAHLFGIELYLEAREPL